LPKRPPDDDKSATNPPGQTWSEILKRPTQEGFAAAFSKNVVVDTSIATRSIVGLVDLRRFFDASRTMYDALNFTHETSAGLRTCLEWEGKFQGRYIAGTTILACDANGVIESVQLYHRPYEQVIAYSAELGRRLEGKIDPSILPELRSDALNAASRPEENLVADTHS
jgi:hypothetical protein